MTLSTLIAAHVQLHRAGARLAGPCPKCGGSSGSDKFSVYPDDTFHCFACGFHGDVITWLREMEGQSCGEAHTTAGIECRKIDCAVFDKCRNGKSTPRSGRRALTPPVVEERGFAPLVAESPEAVWQGKASALVEHAHQALLANVEQLAYLAARGIDRQAVECYRLGWIEKDIYRTRSAWGLPEEISERTKQPKKLWIPAGIVIPFSNEDGVPFRIRIRRCRVDDGMPRYYWLPGSGNDVPVLHPERRGFVVVESDLDAIACAAASDLAGAVPLGTCSAKPKESAAKVLGKALAILVALDGDKAGIAAAKWWGETFPRALRWPVPAGKDPGDYVRDHGGDLGVWIAAGLMAACPAFRVAAPVPPKASALRTPGGDAVVAENASAILMRGVSRHGLEYAVVQGPSYLEAAAQEAPGVRLFTVAEIEVCRGMSAEEADAVMMMKGVFHGCDVKSLEVRA